VFDSSRHLRLRQGFMVVPGQQALHIRSLRRVLRLRGNASTNLLPQVLSQLDGSKSVAEVAVALGEPEQVTEVVALLERAGLLQDCAQTALQEPAPFAALLDGLGVDPAKAMAQLAAHRFGAVVSPALAPYVQESFAAFGMTNLQMVTDADLHDSADLESDGVVAERLRALVVNSSIVFAALDHWHPAFMRLVNQVCVQAGRPWIGVQPESEVNWLIGPLVVPGETACYVCLEQRRQANRFEGAELDDALQQMVDGNPAAARYLIRSVAPLYEPAIALAVTEAVKYAAGLEFYLSTLNRVVGFTPFILETESIPVLKLPRCPVCSRVATAPASRVWMGE